MTSAAARPSIGGNLGAERRFHSSHTRLICDTPGHVREGAASGPYGSRVQPSSLIFVAIIAIWAAFLVQHWVRRREALATARSVDRFSEAIRLLDRTPARVSAEPRPDPQVYAALASPLVARSRVGGGVGGGAGGGAGGARPALARPAAVSVSVSTGAVPGAARPGFARPAGSGSRTSPNRRRSRLALWGRRVRGVSFLGLFALVPVTVVLSALSVLRWTSVLVSIVSLVLGLVMLRYAAVHERTLRKVGRSMVAAERSGQRAAVPAPRRPVVAPARRSVAAPASANPVVAPATPGAVTVTTAEVPVAGAAALTAEAMGSATAVNAPAHEVAQAATVAVAEAGEPAGERASRRAAYARYSADGTWQPVAVPPPTYTLKARAAHPQPEPAEVTSTPESTVEAVEAHVRAVGD